MCNFLNQVVAEELDQVSLDVVRGLSFVAWRQQKLLFLAEQPEGTISLASFVAACINITANRVPSSHFVMVSADRALYATGHNRPDLPGAWFRH